MLVSDLGQKRHKKYGNLGDLMTDLLCKLLFSSLDNPTFRVAIIVPLL